MAVEIGQAQASAQLSPVTVAIQKASEATGVGFDYLINTAIRESSLDAGAQAKTSSAAGLFQFIEQTWLGAVKAYGDRHGLGEEASAITKDSGGVFRVADGAKRDEILNLRFDATASAALAGELAGENKQVLERRLGRAANAADLYTAHFLGPSGAVKLLSAASEVKAADILPAAAKSNAHVFYEGTRAKSVGEVVASIAQSMGIKTENAPESINTPGGAAQFAAITARPQSEPGGINIAQGTSRNRSQADPFELAIQRSEKRSGPVPLIGTKLSLMAMSVLQALDPTRLGSGRSDQDRHS